MPDSPIRIGLIGAGIYMRDVHAPAYRLLNQHYEVAAVYSRTYEAAARLAATFDNAPDATADLAALLERQDIDAVDIALPIEHMPKVIEAALRAGKHVVSEKPAAPDLVEGRRLASIAAQYPRQTWMVAENWRYEAAFNLARTLIDEKRIGTPVFISWTISIRMDENSPYYATEWRRNPQYQGGYLLDVGVHHVAALRTIAGEIAQVSAHMTQVRPDIPPADSLAAAIVFESGLLASYACTFAANAPLPPCMIMLGTDGAIKVDRSQIEIVRGQDVERQPLWDTQPRSIVTLLQDFAAVVRGEKQHERGTPAQALRDIAVMEALFRSAASGRSESVESI